MLLASLTCAVQASSVRRRTQLTRAVRRLLRSQLHCAHEPSRRRSSTQVTDPNDIIIIEGEQERQADLVFTALTVGEYAFCFRYACSSRDVADVRSNEHSSFSDKLVGACSV